MLRSTARRILARSHRGSARRQSDEPAVGERVLGRLEEALYRLPARIAGSGATPGRQGRGCENTLGAMPHQALGEGGRSRHGRCGRGGYAPARHVNRRTAKP